MSRSCPILLVILILASFATAIEVGAQDRGDSESDAAAVAIYADAANFQTNGVTELAIDSWKEFLKKFPQHSLAPKAAHYLGVCYMSTDPPDLTDAANAFRVALQTEKYELRQESLSNRAWCLYAEATQGNTPDRELLGESLKTYQQLLEESPDSKYRDRAFFYSGEVAYTMGNLKQAIGYYRQLLQMDGAEKSSLHCDSLYALGVAQEEAGENDAAAKSYQQLLQACADSDFVVDVQLRLADLKILHQQFRDAIPLLQTVIDESDGLSIDDDKALAMFRLAFCEARLSKPNEAAQGYERLIETFPTSRFVPASRLAAAQSYYQAGQSDRAAEKFRAVLEGDDRVASTEAAHWLVRIALSKVSRSSAGSSEAQAAAESAFEIASQQLARGTEGEYAVALQLDAAEALSYQQDKLDEALSSFEAVASDHSESPLAPRAVYNAAYTALQLGRHDRALELASDFADRYASNPLAPDAAFIGAEANLLSGKPTAAVDAYRELIENPVYRENRQRAQWIMRSAIALQAADEPAKAAEMIQQNLAEFEEPSEKADALMLAGQAELKTGDAAAAAISFQASRDASPDGAQGDEALLLSGKAEMAAGNREAATKKWRELISTAPETQSADQARYQLGQLASGEENYKAAIKQFDPVIESGRDPALRPFALYGKGWAQMSLHEHAQAAETLSRVIDDFPQHPIFDDALLARGITYRSLERYDQAASDLKRFLATMPEGERLGHALYELALVQQNQNLPGPAAASLRRIVEEVPAYPEMGNVIYELGWSLKEAGEADAAMEQFEDLIASYPDNPMISEAAYFLGQRQYGEEQWQAAAKSFAIAAGPESQAATSDNELLEKSLYRMGWSLFKSGDYPGAEAAFVRQYRSASDGPLILDAMMMVGESRFKQNQFEEALKAYTKAREKIVADDDTSKTVRDEAERQVRELTLLHGGQSAAQIEDWQAAIQWYDELRERFPATTYLSQVFYETGFAYQQTGQDERALQLYGEVADNYRNAVAARARFMMGEIYFAQKEYAKAIPEFQRVMYGFGAEQAPAEIKNWQGKSAFEAGRCAESLFDIAKTGSAKSKARGFATRFYQYVIDKHADHELAVQAKERLQAIRG
ncbi:tetratricopeptide repeat protein [Allorhodopirellula solitaria]|uniref:Tol-pal system protein YbgF n=1 Tax=Allorhodopirellula solitaria TaxID=2527987 RepID=A0A5C5YFZ9_9BACT|nr:tetratricopeptide repeat protein [Allorhodopirellula solitaria]TWT74260.1 tol-pal system protein YbgF [Allorhodopirellula solitaria]